MIPDGCGRKKITGSGEFVSLGRGTAAKTMLSSGL